MGKKSKGKKNRNNQQTTKQTPNRVVREPENVLTVGSAPVYAQAAAKPASLFDDTSYIRKDIIRILLTLAVLIALLATAVVLNHKTTYLHRAGNKLSTFLRLSK